ncbi:MAG TPA: NAD(P)H-dependent oxidoreductase [Candidatus Nanoarchaeia archaeon]|nr:NAD(P)H-dependent oxidoreductase [Candidatus Nanoarchaeia archaeon]
MKCAIIVGSHRPASESSKVGRFIEHQLKEGKHDVSVLDLGKTHLPLWSEEKWDASSALNKLWKPYSDQLKAAEAFVVISPEWSGMVPAGLKNIFLLCEDYELANKPALIIAVSASRGGSYPVAELRMSSYKNTFICYIPEHVIVRSVKDVLNDFNMDESKKEDFYIKNRIIYSLKILEQYALALNKVRESGIFDYEQYEYGM